MRTFITPNNRNKFRNTFACFAIATVLFVAQGASAQTVRVAEDSPIEQQTTGSFKASIHPVYNSLCMKVHFENPARETVTVLIKNSSDDIVYKKIVGKYAIFHGKFDVSRLPNGDYTMAIQSAHHKYANAFTIQTHQERTAMALNK